MAKKKKKEETGKNVGDITTNLARDKDEIGTTGLNQFGGRIYEEFLKSLQDRQGKKIYREMSENDPTIGSMLFAIEMLMRGVSWDAEPASPDKAEEEKGIFLKSCMDDMDQPWTEVISEILTKLVYGFSVHEYVYKIRKGLIVPEDMAASAYDDGNIGWRRLPIRSQDTIERWELSEKGEVLGVYQIAPPTYLEVFIPAEKMILFRTTARRGNPEGRSILRTAYRPWFYKKRIEEFEGIGVERDLAGLPTALVPASILADDATETDKALLLQIKTIVRNVRQDSQAGVIFPNDVDENGNKLYEFQLLNSGGKKQLDTTKIITRYDHRIAMTVLADFILMGQEKVGSFALASSKTELFATALGAWMDSIAEKFNREAIPKLFTLNGIKGPYPKIVHGDIESQDLGELGEFLSKVSTAGMPLFPDEALDRHIRRVAKLPEAEEESA